MRRWVAWLLSLSVATTSTATITPLDIYVSPTGSDSSDGSLLHPFQSLSHAQAEVRSLKLAHAASPRPINVYLRGGRYELADTLEFTPLDTGDSAAATVTYQAYCDPVVEQSLTSTQPYPYASHLPTPPRLLWNGNGDRSKWAAPMDPFLEMGINRTSNSLLPASSLPLPQPPIQDMDIGDVCVDKANGVGHTCYAGAIATCVSGCMTACTRHVDRETYSPGFYAKYSHLFGKKLAKEEDCVEICALSCRGCESVTLSGAKRIAAGQLPPWTVYKTLASGRSVFAVDLSSVLATVPRTPDNPTIFTTLYMDGVQLPRAGYPDCAVVNAADSLTEFSCQYTRPATTRSNNRLVVDAADFSPRLPQWTSMDLAEVEIRTDSNSLANLRYKIKAVDANEITLGAGGGQLTSDAFFTTIASDVAFRVENVLEELDAPGEWYFDTASTTLYIMPLDGAATTASLGASTTLEIPLLRQLVRVSGSRHNVYTAAAHASHALVETDSSQFASHLAFSQLTFSGTQLLTSDLYDDTHWPVARIGAVYLETVASIEISHCAFAQIGGNAVVVSGESDAVSLHHNNLSFVGSSAVVFLSRVASQRNALGEAVLPKLLASRSATVAFNQIHHVGRRLAHSAAVMVVGATQTVIDGNLVYSLPPAIARPYWVSNADGGSETRALLMRGTATKITIPPTLAQSLATAYEATLPASAFAFEVPVVAKLIGAPECASGSGRINSLYGEPLPFTYTQCSGCCSLHSNAAKIRVAGSGVAWVDATSRSVVVFPGQAVELQATSSAFFNSIVDVYLGFHVETPNQIVELPALRAQWRLTTRKCQYQDTTYRTACAGPCASSNGCGNSNADVQASGVLSCDAAYEADVASLACAGPFEAVADCDGSGVARAHLFYNCSMSCFATSCT